MICGQQRDTERTYKYFTGPKAKSRLILSSFCVSGIRRGLIRGSSRLQGLEIVLRHELECTHSDHGQHESNADAAHAQQPFVDTGVVLRHHTIEEAALNLVPREHRHRECLAADDGDVHLCHTAEDHHHGREHTEGYGVFTLRTMDEQNTQWCDTTNEHLPHPEQGRVYAAVEQNESLKIPLL